MYYKNIVYKQFSDISLDIINNTIYPESYVGYITREVSQQLGLPYAVHQIRYTKYADVEPYGLQEIFQTTDDNIGKFSYRKGDGVHGWSGWKTITTNSDVATKIYPPVTKPCENGMGNLIQQRIGDIVYCTLATYPLIYTILENVIFFKYLTYLPLYNFAIKICDEDFNEYNATVDTLGNITNTSGKNIPLGKKYTMYFSYYTI